MMQVTMTLNCVMPFPLQIILFVFSLLLFTPSASEIDARILLNVHGTGFHRTLEYQIEFGELTPANCHIALYLELPSAVYVNPDELSELRRLGTIQACSFGETDIELFMEKAQRQYVTVCSVLNQKNTTLQLPIHQRYQYASPNGNYNNITLTKPKLLLGCKSRIKEYRVSKTDLCSPCVDAANKWREIPYFMEHHDYVLSVPVGNSSLLPAVTCLTLTITVIGAVFILLSIFKSAKNQDLKKD